MKRWLFREPPAGSPPRGLARELSISPLLLDILWRRGLDSPEELDAYLSARLPDLVPPSRWPQFPQAAEVISKALLDGKKLAVWGDYDVDGITSSTLVLDVLEAHGLEALWHVPDRRSEGYGLNIPAIEELAAQGCGILLTVDCGISDMAAVARARELGMTVVISDHHLPPPELPPADAICNPRLGPEDDMPCPHLAGVGVAFFLMAAVNAALAPHTGRRFKMDKVLDPPAFIKRRKDFAQGLAAYRKINALAMQLLTPGGVFVSCSCSHHLPAESLRSCVQQAAARRKWQARILYAGGQGADHPVHAAMPETAYLKCFIAHLLP